MSDLRERLAEAIERGLLVGPADGTESADSILAADPALARAAEFGLAWEAAEAALPEGSQVLALRRHSKDDEYRASVYHADVGTTVVATGPTATAALLALAARLREGA